MSVFELLFSVVGKILTGILIATSGFFPGLPWNPFGFDLSPMSWHASSTPTTLTREVLEESTTPIEKPAQSESLPREVKPTIPQKTPPIVPAPEPVVSPPVTSPVTPPSQGVGDLNTKTREAVVNILCMGSGGPLKPASASGVIIDPRGIILTNAHVAQYFLLKDYPRVNTVECVIRIGSPARSTYRAELLFMPPTWISANAKKIVLQNPTGTGEADFALLRITERTDPSALLPDAFPFLTPSLGDILSGIPVLLAAYPAGFLDGATIQTNLYLSSARTETGDLFTYNPGGNTDLYSIGGTILSQQGSSGGAVARESDGKLIGIIVTATGGETTADRDLRAIALSHIDEVVRLETDGSFDELLSGDIAKKASVFNITTAPSLTQALIDVIEQ